MTRNYKSFDCGCDVLGDFFDVSKAFDEVWHGGVAFKLEQNGISCNLHISQDLVYNRKQTGVLNRQVSS